MSQGFIIQCMLPYLARVWMWLRWNGSQNGFRQKNPTRSFNCPRVPGNGSWGPGRQLARYRLSRVAVSSVVFFKEVGSFSGVTPSLVGLHRHFWWADAFRKRTSAVRERRKPPCRAWSGIPPWTGQALVALPYSPKDHRHTSLTTTTTWRQSTEVV